VEKKIKVENIWKRILFLVTCADEEEGAFWNLVGFSLILEIH
jgi:hypothetical protein